MDTFQTLAEVAVAVAGFSSLAIVFRGSNSNWSGQDYISLAFALCWSIGSVFLSLLLLVLTDFGIELATAARIGLFSTVVYMLTVGVLLTWSRRRTENAGGGDASLNTGLTLLYGVIVLGALLAGSGVLPGPAHAWLAAAITLLMAHATAELGLLVISVVKQSD